jgi:phage terminase large subunit-like protein
MAFKDQQDDDYVVGLVADRRGADIYLIAPVSCCGAQGRISQHIEYSGMDRP